MKLFPRSFGWLLLSLGLFGLTQTTVQLAAESQVTYTASRPGEVWSGTAPIKSLELDLYLDNLSSSSLRVTVDAASFNSGNIIRDTNGRRTVFKSSLYPEIIFESTRVNASGNRLPPDGNMEITLAGDLTLHGVTKPLELIVTIQRVADQFTATGGFEVLLSDFEMSRPTLFGVSANDEVRLEFLIVANL